MKELLLQERIKTGGGGGGGGGAEERVTATPGCGPGGMVGLCLKYTFHGPTARCSSGWLVNRAC